MKTFYVIKHDASWLPRIYGCPASHMQKKVDRVETTEHIIERIN